jgi:hypothetical protein
MVISVSISVSVSVSVNVSVGVSGSFVREKSDERKEGCYLLGISLDLSIHIYARFLEYL